MNYLEVIADKTPEDIAIAWTGPKVISPIIESEHLDEVTELLKRKPYLWENFFANDGPKNCKFLKIKPYTGRDRYLLSSSEAFAFNLMNQPELSKIVFLASKYVLVDGASADVALEKALFNLCTGDLAKFIIDHREDFLVKGIDALTEAEKKDLGDELLSIHDSAAVEIRDWLLGKYTVGSECLTD